MANHKCNFKKAEISVGIDTANGFLEASAPVLYSSIYTPERIISALKVFLRQYFRCEPVVVITPYHDTFAPFSVLTPSSADKFAIRLVSLITLQL